MIAKCSWVKALVICILVFFVFPHAAGLYHSILAKFILDTPAETVLDFHGPNWFSEVQTTFLFNGKEQPVTLFMELEKDHLGSKWVIQKVYADVFASSFVRDTTKVGRFLGL